MNKLIKYTALLTVIFLALASLSFHFLKGEDLANINLYFDHKFNQLNTNEIKEISVEKNYDIDSISKIEINLSKTDIRISKSKDSKLHLKINAAISNNLNEDEELNKIIKLNDKTLTLDFLDSFLENNKVKGQLKYTGHSIEFNNIHSIELEVPVNIHELTIKTTTSDLKIEKINLHLLNINTVSGDVSIDCTSIQNLNFSTVSGDGTISLNDFSNLNFNSTSGDLKLKTKNKSNILFHSVSGDLTGSYSIEDKNANNQLILNTVSGDIEIN